MKKFIKVCSPFVNRIVPALEEAEEKLSKLTDLSFHFVTYPGDIDPDNENQVWVKLVDDDSLKTLAGEYIDKNASVNEIIDIFVPFIK